MKRKAAITAVGVVAVGLTGGAFRLYKQDPDPEIRTQQVDRGAIVETIGATGTLEAVKTVQVGTQVSGTVQALYADFNSIVRKGEVIARLDPSLIQTQVAEGRANLARAEADSERLRVGVSDAEVKLQRAKQLSERQLIPATDLDTADVNLRSARAQLRSAEAQIAQARASLTQTEVNLQKTVITAPIDGTVIARNVDVGQTVAASLQAPTLYVIAADLAEMRVNASIDESDVGRVRPGQHVTFHVDAFPAESFFGTVSQVRLDPVTVQNVVTYAAIIDVPNAELKLRPGMTATVSVEAARRDGVIRVPNTALRFKPTPDIFAALGQTAPASPARPARPEGSTGAIGSAADATVPAAEARQSSRSGARVRTSATSGMFAPLQTAETSAQVWRALGGKLKPVSVRLGVTDGTYTELLSTNLEEGVELVTAVNTGLSASDTRTKPSTSNPLMGPQPPRGAAAGGRR